VWKYNWVQQVHFYLYLYFEKNTKKYFYANPWHICRSLSNYSSCSIYKTAVRRVSLMSTSRNMILIEYSNNSKRRWLRKIERDFWSISNISTLVFGWGRIYLLFVISIFVLHLKWKINNGAHQASVYTFSWLDLFISDLSIYDNGNKEMNFAFR
jgi:hypothetical protein